MKSMYRLYTVFGYTGTCLLLSCSLFGLGGCLLGLGRCFLWLFSGLLWLSCCFLWLGSSFLGFGCLLLTLGLGGFFCLGLLWLSCFGLLGFLGLGGCLLHLTHTEATSGTRPLGLLQAGILDARTEGHLQMGADRLLFSPHT